MGMDISTADVATLLKDNKLVDEIVKKVVGDPEALGELAEDVADQMAECLEDDPAIRQRILNGAFASPEFKKRIVEELVDELGD